MFIATLTVVYAATATTVSSIETYDSSGVPRTVTGGPTDPFFVGEYIYISWVQSPSFGSVDVSAIDPSLSAVSIYKVSAPLVTPNPGVTPENALWTSQLNADKGCLAIYAATAGVYQITLDGSGAVTATLDVTVNLPTITLSSDEGPS